MPALAEARQIKWAADVEAELVTLERRRIRRSEVEEVARVERVVAQELEDLAVKLVRTRACGDVDDGSGVAPYSALKVELSALNSCTVLIEGWNVI
jgi:hypothetical protein